MRYRVELDMLYQEAEIFRNSPMMAMTEQHFVIRRFFVTLVGRARMIFTTARREVDNWLKTVLDPLGFQIKEHRAQMETRLRELQKISHSRDTLGSRIDELNRQQQAVKRQLLVLQNMYRRLNDRHPLSDDTPTRPRLVRSRSA
jgi:hypothetical protein